MENSPVLYIDTFLTDSKLHAQNPQFRKVFEELSNFRRLNSIYRERSKVDIFKYTLLSYASLDWKKVYINYECENAASVDDVFEFSMKLFPKATVTKKRSSTAKQFFENLSKINESDGAWIFFSPNNDHPIISNNKINFSQIIKDANSIFYDVNLDKNYHNIESIAFSHYPEIINSIRKSNFLYGYNNIFHEVLHEGEESLLLKPSRPMLDSLHLYRLGNLKKLFQDEISSENKRVVRLEDLKIYNNNKSIQQYIYVKKYEICRHYDGYNHTRNYSRRYIDFEKCPPLFIPDDIFSEKIYLGNNSSIKIINTRVEKKRGNALYLKSDPIPHFWHKYLTEDSIKNIYNLNPNWKNNNHGFIFYNGFIDKLINYLLSIIKVIKFKIKNIFKKKLN